MQTTHHARAMTALDGASRRALDEATAHDRHIVEANDQRQRHQADADLAARCPDSAQRIGGREHFGRYLPCPTCALLTWVTTRGIITTHLDGRLALT